MKLSMAIALGLSLAVPLARAGEVADGLYEISRDEAAPAVRNAAGREVRPGRKLDLKANVAHITSMDNANSRFFISLHVPFDPKLAGRGLVLVAGGVAYGLDSYGSDNGKTSYVQFTVPGGSVVKTAAGLFEAKPWVRRHPGHRMHVSFVPEKKEFAPGEDVVVKLRISNVGTESFAFMQGGMNRGARDNQYNFSARYAGKPYPDTGDSNHFGGLASAREVKPGDVFEDRVSLRKWFKFERGGRYEILGSYSMDLVPVGDKSWTTLWRDYATARFSVTIAGGKDSSASRPPVRLKLNNDELHAAVLKRAYSEKPGENATDDEKLAWLTAVASVEFYMRNYAKAEQHYREALKLRPRDPFLYANLSVYLGKQGKYKEAEAVARQALMLPGANTMHAHMVLASWEWELGRKEEALARMAAVRLPEHPALRRSYYGCRACFFASVGDEKKVASAIGKALELDDSSSSRMFFERDVIFDRYRDKPWFIKLVGETLAKGQK